MGEPSRSSNLRNKAEHGDRHDQVLPEAEPSTCPAPEENELVNYIVWPEDPVNTTQIAQTDKYLKFKIPPSDIRPYCHDHNSSRLTRAWRIWIAPTLAAEIQRYQGISSVVKSRPLLDESPPSQDEILVDFAVKPQRNGSYDVGEVAETERFLKSVVDSTRVKSFSYAHGGVRKVAMWTVTIQPSLVDVVKKYPGVSDVYQMMSYIEKPVDDDWGLNGDELVGFAASPARSEDGFV